MLIDHEAGGAGDLLQGDTTRRPASALAVQLAAHLVAALSLPQLQLQRGSGEPVGRRCCSSAHASPGLSGKQGAMVMAVCCAELGRSSPCTGGMLAEYEAAAGLLAQLRALGSGPLWPHEAATLAVPRPPSERSITTAVSANAAMHCQETPNATELSVAPGLLPLDVTEVTTCTCGPSSMPTCLWTCCSWWR